MTDKTDKPDGTSKTIGVLCADPRQVLELIAGALFPEQEGRVTGGALIRRARELAIDDLRLSVALETARYAPPKLDEKTGCEQDAVDRVGRLIIEHAALLDRWTRSELECAAQRNGAASTPVPVGEDAA